MERDVERVSLPRSQRSTIARRSVGEGRRRLVTVAERVGVGASTRRQPRRRGARRRRDERRRRSAASNVPAIG